MNKIKSRTSVSIPLIDNEVTPIVDEGFQLWVDLDGFPFCYSDQSRIPENLQRLVCPNCGTILITIEEIRKRNLWCQDKEFNCPCGFHSNTFLFSYSG